MPQKKNPDALELLRGKSGRTVGQLTGFLTTLKGLPATYNKDLQESQEPMFDAAETIGKSLRILQGVISTLKVSSRSLQVVPFMVTNFRRFVAPRSSLRT
jgi:argininosuccinate lyase